MRSFEVKMKKVYSAYYDKQKIKNMTAGAGAGAGAAGACLTAIIATVVVARTQRTTNSRNKIIINNETK